MPSKNQAHRAYSLSYEGQAWVEKVAAATGLPFCRLITAAVTDLGKRMGLEVSPEDVAAVKAKNLQKKGSRPELSKYARGTAKLEELRQKGFLL